MRQRYNFIYIYIIFIKKKIIFICDLSFLYCDFLFPRWDLSFSCGDLPFPCEDLSFPCGDLPFPIGDLPFPIGDLTIPRRDLTFPRWDLLYLRWDLTIPCWDSSFPCWDLLFCWWDLTFPWLRLTFPRILARRWYRLNRFAQIFISKTICIYSIYSWIYLRKSFKSVSSACLYTEISRKFIFPFNIHRSALWQVARRWIPDRLCKRKSYQHCISRICQNHISSGFRGSCRYFHR